MKDNIRMDLREIDWEIVDWIHLTQDRDQWWAKHIQVPEKAGNFLTIRATISF
jgi:hypothetical protein